MDQMKGKKEARRIPVKPHINDKEKRKPGLMFTRPSAVLKLGILF